MLETETRTRMNIAKFVRNLFIIVTSFYVVQHVYRVCPLNQPISYDYLLESEGKFDPICLVSHKVFHHAEPLFSYVQDIYDASPIKPYVDESHAYFDPYLVKASTYLNKLSSEIAAYREEHEEYVINESYKSMSKVIVAVTDFIKNTVIPVLSDSTKSCCQLFKYYSRKCEIQLYLKFNIYVKPSLLFLVQKFMDSRFGDYYIRFTTSTYFQSFSKYSGIVCSQLGCGITFVVDSIKSAYGRIMAFKSTESYRIVELKQNFLKEYAKYIPDKFNMNISSSSSSNSISISASTTPASLSISVSINSSSPTTTSSTSSISSMIPSSEKYDLLLRNTIKSASDDFENQVNELTEKYELKLHNMFQPELKSLSNEVHLGYEKIHDLLARINEIKDSSNPLYVSRQEYREELAQKRENLESKVQNLENKIDELSQLYVDEVLKIRIGLLETLEEFADSSLTAYSSEIISNGETWDEWKKYKVIKANIVKFRDELIEKKPVNDLSKPINSLKSNIHLLLNEGGSYLAILRAKANIEFQSREKEEREQLQMLEALEKNEAHDDTDNYSEESLVDSANESFTESLEDRIFDNDSDDETETQTITHTRYVTRASSSTAEPKKSEVVVSFVHDDNSDEIKILLGTPAEDDQHEQDEDVSDVVDGAEAEVDA